MEQLSGSSALMPPTQAANGGSDLDAAMAAAIEQVAVSILQPQIMQLMSAADRK